MNVSFYAIARLHTDFQTVTEWGCDTSTLRTEQDYGRLVGHPGEFCVGLEQRQVRDRHVAHQFG
jgi:hypothetical protein